MSNFITIAVDGPSASGKGTLARRLAGQFHLSYLDTGALYRTVAKQILENGDNPDDPDAAIQSAMFVRDHFSWEMLEDPSLRTDTVADATSRSSKIAELRDVLTGIQRHYATNPPHSPHQKPWQGSILDGRDIGTVICPDATIKFYVTASAETRAERRTKELNEKGILTDYETVLKDMKDRDERDSTRAVRPLKPADDAIILDTTDLTADEAFEKACDIVRAAIS